MHSWNGSTWREAPATQHADTVVAWLPSAWEAQVVSLEALRDSGALRARTGTRPPDAAAGLALSSLVLVEPGAEPASLAEAARAMLPAPVVRAGTRMSGYWEVYAGTALEAEVEVTLQHATPGLLTRLTGVGRRPDRALRWSESLDPADGVAARTFTLDLGDLQPGEYDVILSVRAVSGEVLSSATRIDVTR